MFAVSAIFHYLGPAMAVLLFVHVNVLGVAWLRIASAAMVFAVWRRPWRLMRRLSWEQFRILVGLGVVLAAMNTTFYLAVARLPLSTVGAIEFLGIIVLAALGARTRRNVLALVLAAGGVFALVDIRFVDEPLGFIFAFVNCALFVLYVILGHRIANTRPAGTHADGDGWSPVDQLGAAMLIAAAVATPIGIGGAAGAFTHPGWLLAGLGIGICSSVIPYLIDQLAMTRLRRSTFALNLSILPATATAIGVVVLGQHPTHQDLAGIALVISAVAIHRQQDQTQQRETM
ncbi:EamA family transporter [Streptomyces sp. NBC_01511]|uniref:EamA family transporter n=1 Tax=Streptomyces sp. NBC_01511 TaxID=2903889 RepID=UPI003864A596